MDRTNYKEMTIGKYLKLYCGNKWSIFKAKNLEHKFEQTAYYDLNTYYDDENQIVIEDSFYIGD